MKLFLKIFLAIVLLLLIAMTGAVLLFDPNDYKADIISLAKEKTGRDLSIPGDISLSVFPWIGIELGKVELGNAQGFSEQPFAKINRLQVRAKFWPLFEKRLEADTLVIAGLTLNLEKNAQGTSNWDDLMQKNNAESAAPANAKTAKPGANASTALAAFAINGIEITDSHLNWNDQVQKQKIAIKDLQLKIGQLKPGSRIPLQTQFRFQQKDLDAAIDFTSQIMFSEDFKQFSFYETNLETKVKLAAFKKIQSPQLKSALIKLDLDKQTASSQALSLAVSSVNLHTQFSAKQIMTQPQFNGQLKISAFNPHSVAENLDIALPVFADSKALTHVSAELDLAGSLEQVNISRLKMKLDDTLLEGSATVKLAPLDSTVNLLVDNINLDRYLPEASDDKSPGTKESNIAEAALIPVALLSTLNLEADVKVNQFQIKNTHWSKLLLHLSSKSQAKQASVQINPLKMTGYGSTINSAFTIQAKNNDATVTGDMTIKNLQSGALLKDFMGIDKLKGLASISADINSKGITLPQLKQNLNGKLKLSLHDGIITGFDLNHQRQSLDAKLKGKAAPPAPVPVQTEFAELTATAIINKGILNNDDLRAATPFTRVAGKGTVHIPEERLNYIVSVKFTNTADVKNNIPYDNMDAIPLDTIITGTFSKPEIKIDYQKVLQQIAKKELKVQERKLKEKAKTQINQELEKKTRELEKKVGNELKKLFKF